MDSHLKVASSELNAMRALLASEGWQLLLAMANETREGWLGQALASGNTDFAKGQVVGLQKFLDIPQAIVEQAEIIIERYKRDARQEEETEDGRADDRTEAA